MQRLILSCSLLAVIPVLSQTSLAQKPSFEVAAVKLNSSGRDGGSIGPSGDRLVATNVTLKSLMNFAYRPSQGQFLDQQILGGPTWIDTDHFDVQAKLEGNARSISPERLRLMLQGLLEDRFQLRLHRETRELPVYNLVITKGGPRLSENQSPPDPRQTFITFASSEEPSAPLPRGAMKVVRRTSGTILSGTAIPMSTLLNLLQAQSDRIVIDKTGFKGLFDVQVQFTDVRQLGPGAAPTPTVDNVTSDASDPSLFTAIQEELGLKLESGKGSVEVLVIDSVQKPSEN